MTQAWIVLTGPDGRDISAPTEKQLASTLAALFAGPKGEPNSAVLRFGYDDGLMYAAEVSNDGQIRFEEWSDRDCEIALASPRTMSVSQKEALALWTMLAKRQVSRIREMDWEEA